MDIFIVSVISFNTWNTVSKEDYYFSTKEKAEEFLEDYELPDMDVVTIEIHLVSLDTNVKKMIYSQTI